MKKQLILTFLLLTGGLAVPAAAQYRGHGHQGATTEVFISGYQRCGTPIYAKRVYYGRQVHVVPLSGYEHRRYLERQQRIAAQRAYERRIIRERQSRSRNGYGYGYRYNQGGRCR